MDILPKACQLADRLVALVGGRLLDDCVAYDRRPSRRRIISGRCAGSPASERFSASLSSAMNARIGRTARKRSSRLRKAAEPIRRDLGRSEGDSGTRSDHADAGAGARGQAGSSGPSRRRSRSGRRPAREDERAHRRRGEDGLRELVRRRSARRVDELVVARIDTLGERAGIGCDHDELALAQRDRVRERGGRRRARRSSAGARTRACRAAAASRAGSAGTCRPAGAPGGTLRARRADRAPPSLLQARRQTCHHSEPTRGHSSLSRTRRRNPELHEDAVHTARKHDRHVPPLDHRPCARSARKREGAGVFSASMRFLVPVLATVAILAATSPVRRRNEASARPAGLHGRLPELDEDQSSTDTAAGK